MCVPPRPKQALDDLGSAVDGPVRAGRTAGVRQREHFLPVRGASRPFSQGSLAMQQTTGSRAGRWVAAALVAGGAAACAVNPVTGRNQLSLVSEAQEIQLGRQSAVQVQQEIGLVPDSAM